MLDHLVQHFQVGVASAQESVDVFSELIRKIISLRNRLSAGLGDGPFRLLRDLLVSDLAGLQLLCDVLGYLGRFAFASLFRFLLRIVIRL